MVYLNLIKNHLKMIFGINYNLSSKLRLKNVVYRSLNQNNEPQSMHPEENGAVEDRFA